MIQVLSRAMRILEILGENPSRTYSLAEISQKLSLDKGTCANILKTLCSGGFVQQEAPRSGYKLGYLLYHLTGRPVENEELTKTARRDIELLGASLNETALLSIIRNDRRITLYNTVPDREIIVRTSIDKSVYSACTGRVIIANYSPSHLEKLLIRIGLPEKDEWPEVYDSPHPSQALANALAEIKRNGYATQHDANGIVGFAAPLWKNGHVKGAVGIYLPENRLDDKEKLISAVLETAAEINRKISFL
ncbi:MAG: helix-turn-helix domain-containing protein [Bacteroidales bacterium]|nr:helix-turn-helix domain-containing protein [Bacteroidales bacterium]MBR0301380.1 helix-turn-helix domain-containing protein [Bacteroidales bacterium]